MTTANHTNKPLKIKEPDVFKGNKADLQKFLAQSELYITFNLINFDTNRKKIMFIASYIRGAVFAQFKYYIREQFDKEIPEAYKKTTIVEYYTNLQLFIAKLVELYRDDNKERAAEHKLN